MCVVCVEGVWGVVCAGVAVRTRRYSVCVVCVEGVWGVVYASVALRMRRYGVCGVCRCGCQDEEVRCVCVVGGGCGYKQL